MNLIQKQKTFSRLIAKLMLYAIDHGYEITVGEFLRQPETAAAYAARGIGIKNSLHLIKLAADLNFFKDGAYISNGDELLELGEFWESQSGEEFQCCWGGRFKDGNHFSIEHNGVK